jgi:hypothetical protein
VKVVRVDVDVDVDGKKAEENVYVLGAKTKHVIRAEKNTFSLTTELSSGNCQPSILQDQGCSFERNATVAIPNPDVKKSLPNP